MGAAATVTLSSPRAAADIASSVRYLRLTDVDGRTSSIALASGLTAGDAGNGC